MAVCTVIDSVSHFVPERVVKNAELAQLMETSDEWIRERTGIEERRFVEPGTPASELAFHAAAQLLSIAGSNNTGSTPDLIIAATLSPDFYFPGLGTILQHRLNLPTIPALDIRTQCSGLVYALATADAFIKSGQAKTVFDSLC